MRSFHKWANVCVYVCVRACVHVCVYACVLEVMRKMLNDVLQCVYVISKVRHALGSVYISPTPPFLFWFGFCTVHFGLMSGESALQILFYMTLYALVLGQLSRWSLRTKRQAQYQRGFHSEVWQGIFLPQSAFTADSDGICAAPMCNQLHASASVCTVKIPNTACHITVWTR